MAVMTIGKAKINRVEEVRIPNKISYFTSDQDLLDANRYWLFPHFLDSDGNFDLVFHSWIVELNGRVILIDPCNGNDRPHSVPYFDNLRVPYIERMLESGYRPEDIEFVVCTHLHHDHCGWNTQLRAGKWVPTFPKARYIIRRLEYDRLAASHKTLPATNLNIGVFERSVEPVVRAGLADLVVGAHQVIEGISVEPAPGHTLGHQILRLESENKHAFFTGDCFHHPIQLAEPTVLFADADDTDKLISMRRLLVELSVNFDAPLIGAHIPAPYAVRATRARNVLHFAAGL